MKLADKVKLKPTELSRETISTARVKSDVIALGLRLSVGLKVPLRRIGWKIFPTTTMDSQMAK